MVINKLALTQTEIFIKEKVIKCMLKYFSSEDHDFRNLKKFVWHFLHFSVIFYAIMNFQPKKNKYTKLKT